MQLSKSLNFIEIENQKPEKPQFTEGFEVSFNDITWEWDITKSLESLHEIEEPIVEVTPPTADENKEKAKYLLSQTDWIELPSISNIKNTPYLLNSLSFNDYRLALRRIAVNPKGGEIDWPEIPIENWV